MVVTIPDSTQGDFEYNFGVKGYTDINLDPGYSCIGVQYSRLETVLSYLQGLIIGILFSVVSRV